MQKLRIMLQVNVSEPNDYARWHVLHSSVFDEDTTPEMLADTVRVISHRIVELLYPDKKGNQQ